MSVQTELFERKGSAKPTKSAAKVEEILGEGFSVEKFAEHFEVLVDASGGARSVRRLILELAIRGQLSTGHSNDDSARRLFDEAHSDRVARQSRGEARQMEELAEPGADEVPFPVPSSWLWTRIGLAVNLVNGRAFKPKDWSTSGLPIIRIQNLNNPDAPYNFCAFEVEPKHHLRPGDFLISWSGTPGTSFGAFIWKGPAGVLNQHIFRAEVYGGAYELGFLRVAINARLDEMIAQAHGGVGLQHITKGKLEALAIPLPPLAEQKRIVAKVDQLMALCDELEARQTKKRETGARLTKSALEALTTADGPEEFDAAWKRVVENFDVLIDRAECVGELRRTLLDLATLGRMSGGPVIRCADAADAPIALPHGWRWEECETLCDPSRFITYGVIKLGAETRDGVPTLRSSNVRWLRVEETGIKRIAPELAAEFRRTELRGGEVVVTVRGTLGGVAVVPKHLAGGNVSREVAVLPIRDDVDARFMVFFRQRCVTTQPGTGTRARARAHGDGRRPADGRERLARAAVPARGPPRLGGASETTPPREIRRPRGGAAA